MVAQAHEPTTGPQPATPQAKTKAPQYDLSQIVQDRSDIIVRTQPFVDGVLILIDQLMRKKPDPAKPFLKIGDVTPTQYTHSLLSDFINKGVPYILSKGYVATFPADMNPCASAAGREIAAKLVRRTFQWNARGGRNTIHRRAKLIAARGGYAAQWNYLAGKDKDEVGSGYPLVGHLFDPLDVQSTKDALGVTDRVIQAKRRLVRELPPAWQADYDPRQQVDVYEHWDPVNHGVVINGTDIVKPLTPHGYVDRLGQPMLPWVIRLHDEGEYVFGDGDPTSSAITPLKTLVGHPPAEALIEATQHLSFMLTLLRFCVVNGVLPEKVVNGEYTYDKGRRTYIGQDPNFAVTLLDNAKNLPAILSVIQFFNQLGEQTGMGQNILTGMKQEISGTSAHEQTDLAVAPLNAVRDTLELGLAEEAEMMLAMVASNTEPSTAQRYQRRYGKPLPARNPDQSHNYTNGTPMPMSKIITGNDYDEITSLTFEGCDFPNISVNDVTDLPLEQGYQIGTTFITNPNSPFDPAEVAERFMRWDNGQAAIDRGRLAKLYSNPALPFADLAALKAMVQDKEGELDPTMLENLRNQIVQAEQGALVNTVQQKLTAITSGQNPGSAPPSPQQPGGPPQAPPNANPMQPQQPIGGMSPGIAPPVQSPMPPGVM